MDTALKSASTIAFDQVWDWSVVQGKPRRIALSRRCRRRCAHSRPNIPTAPVAPSVAVGVLIQGVMTNTIPTWTTARRCDQGEVLADLWNFCEIVARWLVPHLDMLRRSCSGRSRWRAYQEATAWSP